MQILEFRSSRSIFIITFLFSMVVVRISNGQTTTYKDLNGTTLQQVSDDMGPTGEAGSFTPDFMGDRNVKITQLDVRKNPNGSCSGSATAAMDPEKPFRMKATYATVLPRWVERNQQHPGPNGTTIVGFCPAVNNEWDRFVRAMTTHEQGHLTVLQNFLRDEAPKFEAEVAALTATGQGTDANGDDAMQNAANALFSKADVVLARAVAKYNAMKEEYDRTTAHGLEQPGGNTTRLDTTITCQ